jgi:tetratricopeptide (TPR) repeat protein
LGIRHRAHQAGTAIFRQTGSPIPFDITTIKAFDYDYQPQTELAKSRSLITTVLRESLKYNRLDSPVQIALAAQRQHAEKANDPKNIEAFLREAENAIRVQDWTKAITIYRKAVQADSSNAPLRLKLGLFLKEQGKWSEALTEFTAAVEVSPNFADALREQGIAENKLFYNAKRTGGLARGDAALREAIKCHPEDYDALASLGGVLKREGRYTESEGQTEDALTYYKQAFECYQQATNVSRGHSYPLLNEFKLYARLNGALPDDGRTALFLTKAVRALEAKTASEPPIDPPWSYFDLSEVRLYAADTEGFRAALERGISYCNASWQPATHRDSLQLIIDGGVNLAGLVDGIRKLTEAEEILK